MNSESKYVQFESDQLPAFLEHIASDEARELKALRDQYESEARAIRAEARRASREFHHRIAEETRTRTESEYARLLSRAKSDFRRRRWHALLELRERARAEIWNQLKSRWQEPEAQFSWCAHWLLECKQLGTKDNIIIDISTDRYPETLVSLENLACEHAMSISIVESPDLSPGLVIRFGARSIDGQLESQVELLLESVNRQLAKWVHSTDELVEDDQ